MNHFKSLFLLIASIVSVQTFGQQHPDEALNDLICREQTRASLWPGLTSTRNYAADQTDMYYQVFHWEVDPALYYIKGEITYCFKSKVPDLTQLVLDMDTTLKINYIRRGDVDLTYLHTDDLLLTIDLNKTLQVGESDTLKIAYEGIPHSTGFGSFEQDVHNGHPILWTQSVPYGVRDWWPAKQDLIDKIDSMDIYITTPSDQLAASIGKLVSITNENGKLVHHWRHRHPIVSYLVAFSVTNYVSYEEFFKLSTQDSIQILNYVYPESLAEAKSMTPAAKNIMAFYNEKFGVYPFADEKFGHAQFSWGGGTEIQTMNFMTNFSPGLIAHELAHQWFGDKVTCGSYADVWLNEGFATYLNGLTYEQFPVYGSFNNWKSSTRSSVVSEPDGSVFVSDTSDTFRIFDTRLTYHKGAYVLHMLRWVVGDDAFFEACRHYLELAHTSYGFGRTRDLQNELEISSGKDLDEFFADWYYGEGYPSYTIQWMQSPDSISFWIHQTTSHPSVSFFEMPVPIQVIDGVHTYEFVCDNTSQDQKFTFYTGPISVNQIYFDLNKWILSKNNSFQEITTSTSGPEQRKAVSFWPNPANSSITFHSDIPIQRLEIISMEGKAEPAIVNANQVWLGGFPNGVYTLKFYDDKNEVVSAQRLLIQK